MTFSVDFQQDSSTFVDFMQTLTREIHDEKGLSVNEFLINALHAGILMESKDLAKHYMIPIPSFGDYLRKLPIEPPSEMSS